MGDAPPSHRAKHNASDESSSEDANEGDGNELKKKRKKVRLSHVLLRAASLSGQKKNHERTFFAQTKHDDETAAQSGAAVRDAHPPGKKYRLADTMKAIIWQLVCLSNEVVRLENGKNILENSNQVVSDQGVRKTLHQKIPHALLGLVSFMKKKYAKEVIENEA
ncbi:uncharacterized protein C8Q71DRAFT_880458 [Rhodofomes roseus]|uniref:Ubinuclein middle domain-containing protein n=1 Tax=Rhodofomes roseus TaxID=34475 RepID=A0ABQ8K4S5_9APHY|nr:uncharacterized protein C8Q71DRAFT_881407 [Rhodofomes roseus]XP_047774985.1 uncharacterized protein C8Q71DRAFT_880458 [Rhodofomes roseus]KAH9831507.1 hypothetical protein C8Q71DRAFT_881407 [Rhodofomes roseus]KAH9831939.1 hypothetical protein C8Q71DRAFT_880458 [Rhodofomes roseus]